MKVRIKNLIFLSVLIGLLCIFLLSTMGKKNTYDNILVIKVFDGDTILLENGEKVRLIGIDCPEAYESDKLMRDAERSGQDSKTIIEMGKRATEFTKNLIEGKRARLEFDVERRDKYDRLLAYVYVWGAPERTDEDIIELKGLLAPRKGVTFFLNATLAKAGYAQPMTIPPNVKYAELFQKLYQEARENKRGLWNS